MQDDLRRQQAAEVSLQAGNQARKRDRKCFTFDLSSLHAYLGPIKLRQKSYLLQQQNIEAQFAMQSRCAGVFIYYLRVSRCIKMRFNYRLANAGNCTGGKGSDHPLLLKNTCPEDESGN